MFFERKDKPLGADMENPNGITPNQLDDAHITAMQADEDFEFQNQFSQIINMKPGRSRLFTMNALYAGGESALQAAVCGGQAYGHTDDTFCTVGDGE